MSPTRHKNYEVLNLIGYGLAKFDVEFVRQLGFATKQNLYRHIVELKIAETAGVVKNRQDLFDPFFDNGRRGWWQKGDVYIHRKHFIDSLFGELTAEEYARIVDYRLRSEFAGEPGARLSPILHSKFKQIQQTGREAEWFFMHHYGDVAEFNGGTLQDARLFGDGYDFQIQVASRYYLAEVKGVAEKSGSVRLTEKEYEQARTHKADFALVVVSNLHESPKLSAVFNPASLLNLTKRETTAMQISYHSNAINWRRVFP